MLALGTCGEIGSASARSPCVLSTAVRLPGEPLQWGWEYRPSRMPTTTMHTLMCVGRGQRSVAHVAHGVRPSLGLAAQGSDDEEAATHNGDGHMSRGQDFEGGMGPQEDGGSLYRQAYGRGAGPKELRDENGAVELRCAFDMGRSEAFASQSFELPFGAGEGFGVSDVEAGSALTALQEAGILSTAVDVLAQEAAAAAGSGGLGGQPPAALLPWDSEVRLAAQSTPPSLPQTAAEGEHARPGEARDRTDAVLSQDGAVHNGADAQEDPLRELTGTSQKRPRAAQERAHTPGGAEVGPTVDSSETPTDPAAGAEPPPRAGDPSPLRTVAPPTGTEVTTLEDPRADVHVGEMTVGAVPEGADDQLREALPATVP